MDEFVFLIRLKTVGNCIIPDLDNFTMYCGNDKILNLGEYFTEEQIIKSLKHPQGHLKQMLDAGIIEQVETSSIDYKVQARLERQEEELTNQKIANKKTIKQIISDIRNMQIEKAKQLISDEYFDNLSVLDVLANDPDCSKELSNLAKEFMHKNLDKRIDKRFILV